MSNGKQPGRNEPCWCGSGIKYKKCHLNREHQEKPNPWQAVEANKKAFHSKKCFAENSGLGPCSGKIIKAHTVSRGPNLTRIARNGRVVRYSADFAQLNKNGGKLVASEIGIGDASVFWGFCAGHDRTLFSCIENEPFAGRPDQCLAVAYRTLSREYYGKDASSHLRETLRDADKGRNPFAQRQMQHFLDLMEQGTEAAKKDLAPTHQVLTKALVAGHPEVLASMIIEFDGNLPFMLAGAWSPFTDVFGGKLQTGYVDELLEQVFVSTFAGDGRSHLCVSWLDKENAPGKVIADQLRKLPPDQAASGCLQVGIKHIENIFFDPAWFESLGKAERRQLDILITSGVVQGGLPPSAPIKLTLAYALPMASRIFDVGENTVDGGDV